MKVSLTIMRTLLFCLIAISSNAQQWAPLPNSPAAYRFNDIFFLSPNEGWAINGYTAHPLLPLIDFGRVFKTNDGGQTWLKIHDSSETHLRCVGFADNQNGWIGNVGTLLDTIPLYRTTDGGASWNPVTNIPSPVPKGICGISVVTDSVIYAYGRYYSDPIILKSTDKGSTWSSTDLSSMASGLVDAHFVSKDTGFITGCTDTFTDIPRALILSTVDGGQSWQESYKCTSRFYERVWKIVFPSKNVGYASIENVSGSLASSDRYILKTTDGGITWNELPFISSYDLQAIGFINNNVGWVGGSRTNPINYITTDGGNSWTPYTAFGLNQAPYDSTDGIALNRFRRFGDTLMYASGNRIYKYKTWALSTSTALKDYGSLYPNPAKNLIFLRLHKIYSKLEINIYDLLGRKVVAINPKPAHDIKIEIADLKPGTYLMQATSVGSKIYSGKIVVIE